VNFTANIVNNANPAVTVSVADASGGVTYAQIKNSLGQQVYDVSQLYIYSTNLTQLIGVIKYQRYDVTGNQKIFSIATTVDPYQFGLAIALDLDKTPDQVILNGNSSLSATILPNTSLVVKLICKRVTNSFGMNLNNFRDMERITRSQFFNNYGQPIEEIQKAETDIKKSFLEKPQSKKTYLTISTIAFISAAAFLLYGIKKSIWRS